MYCNETSQQEILLLIECRLCLWSEELIVDCIAFAATTASCASVSLCFIGISVVAQQTMPDSFGVNLMYCLSHSTAVVYGIRIVIDFKSLGEFIMLSVTLPTQTMFVSSSNFVNVGLC